MGRNTLLSHPQSGNHWVRFIIEYLTGYPTYGIGKRDIPIYLNHFPSTHHPLGHVDPNLGYLFYKTHKFSRLNKEEIDSLLFIIRDYRECCLYRKIYKVIRNEDNVLSLHNYLDLIVFYDGFAGKKALIYYEDLLTSPEQVVQKIADFISHVNRDKYAAFLRNYETLRQLSIKGSRRNWDGNNSNFNLIFYQEQIEEAEKRKRDAYFDYAISDKRYECTLPYIARYMIPDGLYRRTKRYIYRPIHIYKRLYKRAKRHYKYTKKQIRDTMSR